MPPIKYVWEENEALVGLPQLMVNCILLQTLMGCSQLLNLARANHSSSGIGDIGELDFVGVALSGGVANLRHVIENQSHAALHVYEAARMSVLEQVIELIVPPGGGPTADGIRGAVARVLLVPDPNSHLHETTRSTTRIEEMVARARHLLQHDEGGERKASARTVDALFIGKIPT